MTAENGSMVVKKLVVDVKSKLLENGLNSYPKTNIFSSPGSKNHVCYCFHLASLVFNIVVCKLFIKHFVLWSYLTEFNESWYGCFLRYWAQIVCLNFLSIRNMAASSIYRTKWVKQLISRYIFYTIGDRKNKYYLFHLACGVLQKL